MEILEPFKLCSMPLIQQYQLELYSDFICVAQYHKSQISLKVSTICTVLQPPLSL